MTTAIATTFVQFLQLYLGLGLAFAIPFVLVGAGRIDPAAKQGSRGFRIVIVPGAMALWPLLAWRWFGGSTTPPAETTPHKRAAREQGAAQAQGDTSS